MRSFFMVKAVEEGIDDARLVEEVVSYIRGNEEGEKELKDDDRLLVRGILRDPERAEEENRDDDAEMRARGADFLPACEV